MIAILISDHLNAVERITERIHRVRDLRVMLDRDPASPYQVETRMLKLAVRCNSDRSPPDFMFELSGEELKNWRSQFVTIDRDKRMLRETPMTLTQSQVS